MTLRDKKKKQRKTFTKLPAFKFRLNASIIQKGRKKKRKNIAIKCVWSLDDGRPTVIKTHSTIFDHKENNYESTQI